MTDSNPEGRQANGMSPQGLRLDDLARILTALGVKPVTVEMLQADLDDGAPTNPDGTVNVVQYLAWLLKEGAGAGD
jgi:hypothetical protein